jgi:hypothetical protein
VLIAYSSVYAGWTASFGANDSPPPQRWLLIQLFPNAFLQSDVFERLATEIYKHCNPEEVLKFTQFPHHFLCVIDDAQKLGQLLVDKFCSVSFAEDSIVTRPLLSPFLSGIKQAMLRLPTIAGTGLTLLKEWPAVGSSMAVSDDFIFTDFPLLTEQEVEQLLRDFLIVSDEWISHAVGSLHGRPRFVTQFITRAITKNQTIKDELSKFVREMMCETKSDGAD